MTEPLGGAQPQAATSAVSTAQRLDTATGDRAEPRSDLTGAQSAVEIGGSVPLVFCRRTGGYGGVWVDPPAVEARLLNDNANNVTVTYQLVLSDGEITPPLPGDLFQGDRQRGVGLFAYGQRAGTWEPGNYLQQRWQILESTEVNELVSGSEQTLEITLRPQGDYITRYEVTHENVSPGLPLTALNNYLATAAVSVTPNAPEPSFTEYGDLAGKAAGGVTQYFRQTIEETNRPPFPRPAAFSTHGDMSGSYEGMTMLSFEATFLAAEGDAFKQQTHVFIRSGIEVYRLLTDDNGPSNLLPDLAAHLLSSRTELIDYDLMTQAAGFCNAQGFRFDVVLTTPNNIRDYLNRVAPLMMLTVTQRQGAIGLRPAVPINSAFAIYTGPTISRFTFDESNIVEDSLEISYTPGEQRNPFAAEMLWRQQPDGDIGLIRATQVRYADTPEDAPVEQYDMTEFCTSHVHAVKVAASILSRRRHVTHTARLTAVPGGYAAQLVPGDVVEVLARRTSEIEDSYAWAGDPNLGDYSADHHYYYQVNSVSTNRVGDVMLELTHWPVDEDGVSVVALDVANVDPGAVSTSPGGVPTPIAPVDPLFDESYFSNFFATLTFLPITEANGYLTICVQSSIPIPVGNGDLILTLNIGYAITIEEGQTVGCVNVPLSIDLLDDILIGLPGDIDDIAFDLNPDIGDITIIIDGIEYPLDDFLIDFPGNLDDIIVDPITGDITFVIDGIEYQLEDLLIDLPGNLDDIIVDPDAGDWIITIDDIEYPLDDFDIGPVTIDNVTGGGFDTGTDGDLGDSGDLGDLGDLTGVGGIGGIGGLGGLGYFGGIGEIEDLTPEEGACYGPSSGFSWYNVEQVGTILNVSVALYGQGPGAAPSADLGPVNVTVQVAGRFYVNESGNQILPQPSGFPNASGLNTTFQVASPGSYQDALDTIFVGTWVEEKSGDWFPSEEVLAIHPGACIRTTLAITGWNGGFCNMQLPGTYQFDVCAPTGGGSFFAIVNTNSARDDDFAIYYNGTFVGEISFATDQELTGHLFHFGLPSAEVTAAKASAGSNVVWRSTNVVSLTPPESGATVTIAMNNAGRNNNGNYGVVYAGRAGGTVSGQEYSPPDGGSESFSVVWPAP